MQCPSAIVLHIAWMLGQRLQTLFVLPKLQKQGLRRPRHDVVRSMCQTSTKILAGCGLMDRVRGLRQLPRSQRRNHCQKYRCMAKLPAMMLYVLVHIRKRRMIRRCHFTDPKHGVHRGACLSSRWILRCRMNRNEKTISPDILFANESRQRVCSCNKIQRR